jgi:hypothetical protein
MWCRLSDAALPTTVPVLLQMWADHIDQLETGVRAAPCPYILAHSQTQTLVGCEANAERVICNVGRPKKERLQPVYKFAWSAPSDH